MSAFSYTRAAVRRTHTQTLMGSMAESKDRGMKDQETNSGSKQPQQQQQQQPQGGGSGEGAESALHRMRSQERARAEREAAGRASGTQR